MNLSVAVRRLSALSLVASASIIASADSPAGGIPATPPAERLGSAPLPVANPFGPKGRLGDETFSLVQQEGVQFFYAGVYSPVEATSFAVDLTLNKPHVAAADYHSLSELAVVSDGDIVEIGWIVDQAVDEEPHLFVFHWVDGQPTCYDACGFVQTSVTYRPGMQLDSTGSAMTFAIEHRDDKWYVGYAGEWLGYFPDALWHGQFTRSERVQIFGEVASTKSVPGSEMGSGLFPGNFYAAQMTRIFTNSATPAPSYVQVTNPDWYAVFPTDNATFAFGGPGGQAPFVISSGITGDWYNPKQSGHGFTIEAVGDTLLANWSVFDNSGHPIWIVASGPIADNSAVLDAYTVSGGGFPPNFDESKIQRTHWGRLKFEFSSCRDGNVSWQSELPGYPSGSMPLSRLTQPNGLVCF